MKSFDAIKGAPSRSWWCSNGQSWDQQPVFSGDNRKQTQMRGGCGMLTGYAPSVLMTLE